MDSIITVAELFAGVGGFRLGLEGYSEKIHPSWTRKPAGPFKTIWANQWEPPGSVSKQFAARCYTERFGSLNFVNEDIHEVLVKARKNEIEIPSVDLVVGGFPCQDYSVAKPLSQASGIEGKKGVLWWDIYTFLQLQLQQDPSNVQFCLFENVDRLLKSPASQRGRDFAIILQCLNLLSYNVEWQVINSAAYGYPQRRKRVFIFCTKRERKHSVVLSEAFPIAEIGKKNEFDLPSDLFNLSQDFNKGGKKSPFLSAGCMRDGHVITYDTQELYTGSYMTLGDVLEDSCTVDSSFYLSDDEIEKWKYLKGAKREPRINKKTGHAYVYSEGQMAFPDLCDKPSRTILTGEGGRAASRFKHVIKTEEGKFRRLTPNELDALQGFPSGWTDVGMSEGQRAFCMGNALVVDIVSKIGKVIAKNYATNQNQGVRS